MNNVAVELVQFKIARGVDEESFLRASDAVQSILNKSRGFVHRELARTPDGLHWVDIVKWRSREEAEQASKNVVRDPTCVKFFQLIDRSSVKTHHMEISRSYY